MINRLNDIKDECFKEVIIYLIGEPGDMDTKIVAGHVGTAEIANDPRLCFGTLTLGIDAKKTRSAVAAEAAYNFTEEFL